MGAAIAGVASGVGELAGNAVVAALCPGPVDIQASGVHRLSCLSKNLSIESATAPTTTLPSGEDIVTE